MIVHRGSRKRRNVVDFSVRHTLNPVLSRAVNAVQFSIEQLEERRMLTTMRGGDTFEFQDYSGIVRVHVDGPASTQVDLIGATSFPDDADINGNRFELNDLPGTTRTSDGKVIDK